MNIAKRLIRII